MPDIAPRAGGFEALPEFPVPAAVALAGRRPRTLKHGDTFAVFDDHGDAVPAPNGAEGLYFADTRHLSRFELRLNGRRPLLLGSSLQDDNAVLTVDLANSDVTEPGGATLLREMIHIVRTKFLWNATCYERIGIRNFDLRPRRITVSFAFAADFADVFEVRGVARKRRGVAARAAVSADTAVLRYVGLDGIERATEISFSPAPIRLGERTAAFDLTVAPQEHVSLFVSVACVQRDAPPRTGFFAALRQARRDLRRATSRAASIETSNAIFNELLCRSTADLYMLMTDTDHGPYPYAGVPWYSTAFGRDGIITALELLATDPEIAKGTLRFLAETQATEVDPERDAEPGKILHETRQGEMARRGEVPFDLYYGSVDATPLFVLLASRYLERTGDIETIRQIWPNVEAALGWIDRYGDFDGDGFVEYQRRSSHGLINQGWKDSHDSVFHADGTLAPGPIALCEVQAYVQAAKAGAAIMARALDRAAQAATLDQQSETLREQFEAKFWRDELGFYALALDGAKCPCLVRASNAGHALLCGTASSERASRVAERLLGRDFFTGWGIRTLAGSESRFNPMSYHNGSVWPHDNALIGMGLARYGFKDAAVKVLVGLFDAATYMDLRRLPELFCGLPRRRHKGPTAYPSACSPQSWAAAAPIALVQACLGLEFDHARQEIRLRAPAMPHFLDQIRIRNLRLGEAVVDLEFRRYGGLVAVTTPYRAGDVRITVVQ